MASETSKTPTGANGGVLGNVVHGQAINIRVATLHRDGNQVKNHELAASYVGWLRSPVRREALAEDLGVEVDALICGTPAWLRRLMAMRRWRADPRLSR